MRSAKNINDLKIIVSLTENKIDEQLLLKTISDLLLDILNRKNENNNISQKEELKTKSVTGEKIDNKRR